tara:strand:- start:145 stop:444 length:300 start_codon:yes stop_codon:yes gene_type:complete
MKTLNISSENKKPSLLKGSVAKHQREQSHAQRSKMKMGRFMNNTHPEQFEDDMVLFSKWIRREHNMARNEMIEFAIYSLREQLTGEAIPPWVSKIKPDT